jgi:hypothetical protein
MNRRFAADCLPLLLLSGLLLGGCAASGPKHAEIMQALPTLNQGHGRIYFYRDRNIVGAAIQPNIRLNGEVVGSSTPGGFFFVDRAEGKYSVAVATEVENRVEFNLAVGQTRYVRTYVSMGILIGRVYPQLIEPDQARADLGDLHYTGDPSLVAQKSERGATTEVAKSPGSVKMDDLQGLLPADGQSRSAGRPGDRKMEDLKNLLPTDPVQ